MELGGQETGMSSRRHEIPTIISIMLNVHNCKHTISLMYQDFFHRHNLHLKKETVTDTLCGVVYCDNGKVLINMTELTLKQCQKST
jgi:hypothetical protein